MLVDWAWNRFQFHKGTIKASIRVQLIDFVNSISIP